jgi:hypothetical protein
VTQQVEYEGVVVAKGKPARPVDTREGDLVMGWMVVEAASASEAQEVALAAPNLALWEGATAEVRPLMPAPARGGRP